MGFQVRGVDLELFGNAFAGGKVCKYSIKDPHPAPSHKAVIQRLVRTIVRRCVAPLQTALDHMNDPGNNSKVIDPRDAVR